MSNPEIFDPTTVRLLNRFDVQTHPQIDAGFDVSALSHDHSHLHMDLDGTVRKYGQDIPEETMQWLMEVNKIFHNGISLGTNSTRPPNVEGVPSFVRSGLNFKQRKGALRNFFDENGINTSETVAMGDHPSDMIAYISSGVKKKILVRSIGAHPVQELVSGYIYSPGLRVAKVVLGMHDTMRRLAS